ncbi:phosphotransferase [Phenylobacterium soli]|uniref:Aminoglycoside phosphotransferase n=1 Tax=Phenylobacterium soli TaxID=2170551 RepID=A0A328AGM5_9CAUL|nr:phosphotransferase [Phenylobacterium soli]RAK53266.1 aminoglycoside phosphotransferase [Phenylobacterium soli]
MPHPIPEARRADVAAALVAAFGTSELDAEPVVLSGGLSGARLLRIRLGGVPYVLRLEAEASPYAPPARARTYACMRAAAEAVLSPRVWHADPAAGITIIDFIPQAPLADYPGDGEGMLVELAQSLRVLHQLPPFPAEVDFLDGVAGLIERHLAAGLLSPETTAEVFERFQELRTLYRPRPADLVSSHNDLNPANILYDGRRLWLIDWEVAFLADRFLDLAAVANWFGQDASGERRLLGAYFGREPEGDELGRLRLMRQANHVYYGVIFLIGAAAERPGVRLGGDALRGPSLEELRQRLRTGGLDLASWENRIAYGKARLSAALVGMRDTTFGAALAAL